MPKGFRKSKPTKGDESENSAVPIRAKGKGSTMVVKSESASLPTLLISLNEAIQLVTTAGCGLGTKFRVLLHNDTPEAVERRVGCVFIRITYRKLLSSFQSQP